MNRLVIVILLLFALYGSCYADALVFTQAMKASTIAEYYVDEHGIRLELEVGAADLPAFRNLLPDELYQKLDFKPEPLADRLLRFFGEDLVILSDGQSPLAGRIVHMQPRKRIVRDDITGQPLPVQPEDAEVVVFAQIEYAC